MRRAVVLEDFDILGIIKLKDVDGIDPFVTEIESDEKQQFLSRSKEYYNVKTLSELSNDREFLKSKLTAEMSKRNFVILENMLNSSARSFFKIFEERILDKDNEVLSEKYLMAKQCLEEDSDNLVKILSNKGLIRVNPSLILPTGKENCAKRAIEMDNKMLIYLFAKSFNVPKDHENVEIVTPGYGAIHIGPFFKSIYGCDYTNIYKSKYIAESHQLDDSNILDFIIEDKITRGKKDVILLDDNIGTGNTLKELSSILEQNSVNVIGKGAIQYNWRNYKRISTGEKEDIDRFNVEDFDYVTTLNYAGHKLYKHAIDLLHSSGDEYIGYLKSKSYQSELGSDIDGSVMRSVISAKQVGVNIPGAPVLRDSPRLSEQCEVIEKYRDIPQIFTESSEEIISEIHRIMEKLKSNPKVNKEKLVEI